MALTAALYARFILEALMAAPSREGLAPLPQAKPIWQVNLQWSSDFAAGSTSQAEV
jgi:hypothetical protein